MIQTPQAPENSQELDQPSIDEPLKKSASPIRKMFDASSWFVFFAFLPITVLVLLSQNTIPGDLFYPIKRGMENVVLAAATVSPATRVAFRTDLTGRRFDEAEKLLLARADTTGLSDFVKEVQTAQQEVSTLSNQESKKESTEKLIKKIDEYQNKLSLIQAKRQNKQVAPPLPTNTPIPTPSQLEVTPTPTPASIIQKVTPASTQQIISPKPTGIERSLTRSTEPSLVVPTIEVSPTQVQIPPSTTSVPSVSGDKVGEAIDDTQERLDKIKDKLKERPEEKVKKEKKIKEEEKSTQGDIKDEEEKKEKHKGKK